MKNITIAFIVTVFVASCGISDGDSMITGPGPGSICSTNNGGCSPNAQCSQSGPNSRTCKCNSGYYGDGVTCTQQSDGQDTGNGFGPGPYNVVVENSSRAGYVNGCAGDTFSGGNFACWYHPEWDSPALAQRSGTSVSFTLPALAERSSLDFYFNDCATPGTTPNNCAFSLAGDTVVKDPNSRVWINGILVGQSLSLFRDGQRIPRCPSGCPNGRIRLR